MLTHIGFLPSQMPSFPIICNHASNSHFWSLFINHLIGGEVITKPGRECGERWEAGPSSQFGSLFTLTLNHKTHSSLQTAQYCEAKKKSGSSFAVYRRGTLVAQKPGASCTMTSSTWMKTQAATKALS